MRLPRADGSLPPLPVSTWEDTAALVRRGSGVTMQITLNRLLTLNAGYSHAHSYGHPGYHIAKRISMLAARRRKIHGEMADALKCDGTRPSQSVSSETEAKEEGTHFQAVPHDTMPCSSGLGFNFFGRPRVSLLCRTSAPGVRNCFLFLRFLAFSTIIISTGFHRELRSRLSVGRRRRQHQNGVYTVPTRKTSQTPYWCNKLHETSPASGTKMPADQCSTRNRPKQETG